MIVEKITPKIIERQLQKRKFPFLIFSVFVVFLAAVIYFVLSGEKVSESEKLRFQVLKNMCLRGETLSEDEKEEFCKLLRETEKITDCETYLQTITSNHLAEILVSSEKCLHQVAEKLRAENFETSLQNAENLKGKVLNVSKNKALLFQIRIMHRTSGGKQYRQDYEYFSLFSVPSNSYYDVLGEKTNTKEKRHIKFESCEALLETVTYFLAKNKTP